MSYDFAIGPVSPGLQKIIDEAIMKLATQNASPISMIKRVTARLEAEIAKHTFSDPVTGLATSECPAEVLARAAIEALRDPTEEMISSGGDAVYLQGGPPTKDADRGASAAWTAMIDVALAEKPGDQG